MNLNPITFLQTNVENLWYSIYSLIAGWGLTMTIIVATIVVLAVRLYRCERQVENLQNRLIHAERDYNLTLERWKKS
jgi:uncharacterized membrane protein